MAVTVRIHPGKRKANPMFHGKTAEKPRLGPLNISQLKELAEKTISGKNKAKYEREIARKEAMINRRKT
jgi:hypothetical protein|tara:strand:+ start:2578 stop:2784 length:207 start_codon:yes stop_codon:yes gene_type:complete